MDKIIYQKKWHDNLAAALATYCVIYDLKISKTSIFESFTNTENMEHFKHIEDFAKKYNIEWSKGFFDASNLKSIPCPSIVLVKGYRSVIVTEVNDKVNYIDVLSGENSESLDDFKDYSTGHYFYLNPKSDYKQEENYDQICAEEDRLSKIKTWVSPELVELVPEKLMDDFKERI